MQMTPHCVVHRQATMTLKQHELNKVTEWLKINKLSLNATAQYTLILVATRTLRSLQRRLVSLPNDPITLPIRAEGSSSFNAFCDLVLPN